MDTWRSNQGPDRSEMRLNLLREDRMFSPIKSCSKTCWEKKMGTWSQVLIWVLSLCSWLTRCLALLAQWCHLWEGISLRHNLSAPVRGHSNSSRLESLGVSTGHLQTRALFIFPGGDSIPPPAAPRLRAPSWTLRHKALALQRHTRGCELSHSALENWRVVGCITWLVIVNVYNHRDLGWLRLLSRLQAVFLLLRC